MEPSTPVISRKTSKGIPRYQGDGSLLESDTFLLSGAEDLIPLEATGGITRYRPRTETLFARIERHRTAKTDHWEVRSKDGLISVYGTPSTLANDPAAIANPENRNEVFSWKLTKTLDPFGNTIEYEYERETGDGADHCDQLYLKRIRYADYTQTRDGGLPVVNFLVTATFIYEERPDAFSDHRAGFEIRTRLRCTRIEIRTHADRERLVRVYRLIYLDQRDLPAEQLPFNATSLLSQVVVEGCDDDRREALPALEFGYTAFEPTERRYQPLGASGSRPERSLGHSDFELIDLFSNGLPTVVELNEQVRYWRNRGDGSFDHVRTMQTSPASVRLSEAGVQLLDADGNGRSDLMVIDGQRTGYYPLTSAGEWHEKGFVRYRTAPSINLDAPDVRLLDLDGDGVTDALRTGPQFELYYNDAEDGWSSVELRDRIESDAFPERQLRRPARQARRSDRRRPAGHRTRSLRIGRVLALSRLRSLGPAHRHAQPPRFEDAAFFPGIGFDPKRLLAGDVDGDGVADLVYVSSGHVTVWINQHGNRWSDPILIHGTPPVTDATAVRLADMLGTGTDGILWTYDFGAFPDSTYKFLDLTGGIKPYLLDRMDNQMGAAIRIAYAPSTRFYLQDDARAETRWRTPLPFPVQVVSRVETIDAISRGKLRPNIAITTATGTGRSVSSAASAWSNNSTPSRSRTITRLALETSSSKCPRNSFHRRSSRGPGSIKAQWMTTAAMRRNLTIRRSTGRAIPRRSRTPPPSIDSCSRWPIRATGVMRCARCAEACCAPSSTPSTAPTRRIAPIRSPSRHSVCAKNQRRNLAICRGRGSSSRIRSPSARRSGNAATSR